ncbi:MAG TPA: hypothetical protein VER33_21185 [Polyangiaceae bacterium]|nr:hypothetical protein [Polyangiaceae bacterium]
MSAAKKTKKQKVERRERRFTAEPTYASRLNVGIGMLGAAALGAGVYAQWVREEAFAFAPYLVGAGVLGLGGALWRGEAEVGHVRVGDGGVVLERSSDSTRILWCDIERISIEGGRAFVRGKDANLSFPVDAHPKATAWLVSEAGRRVPDVVAVPRAEVEKLLVPSEGDGELVSVEDIQVTGRHCRATGKPIAFERHARECPTCGETYLKDEVPKRCLTCQAELGTRAREA